jgi:hypothetical protein
VQTLLELALCAMELSSAPVPPVPLAQQELSQ